MELNTQELKDYLFHVRDLELLCYKQRQYIAEIERMRSEAPPRQLSFKKEPEVEPLGLVRLLLALLFIQFSQL